jgi:hypothetical protein
MNSHDKPPESPAGQIPTSTIHVRLMLERDAMTCAMWNIKRGGIVERSPTMLA